MEDPPLCDSISEKMDFLYKYKYGTNIKFLVGNDSHDFYAVLSASDFILGASSPEFEKRTDPGRDVLDRYIALQEYDPRIFRNIIRFMYTDNISFHDPLEFIQIFTIANEFSILNLIKICENYMQKPKIHGGSAVSWLKAGIIVNSSFLKLLSIDFIESHPEEVLNHKSFPNIEIEHFHRIFRTLGLQLLSEVTLLRALCKWVTCNNGKDAFKHKTLEELMFENLRFIHFQSLTAQEFDSILADYKDNFRQSDIFDIFSVIAETDWEDYPEWMRRPEPRILRKVLTAVNCVGPTYRILSKKFVIAVEEAKNLMNINLLETTLKVVAKKPVVMAGLAVICPNTTVQEKVTVLWECYTFGFYDKASNEMSYEGDIKVENNNIKIIFPEQFGMDTSLVFVIKIKINFEYVKSLEIPSHTAVPPKSAVFVPYGRSQYFKGDIIVKELYYF